MNLKALAIIFMMMVVVLASDAYAVHWSSIVSTNTSSWSIYREGDNLTFDYSSSINGEISPIEYHGSILHPYYAYYAEIGETDVRLRDRISALEGRLISADKMNLQSRAYPNDIEIYINKPSGSDVYTIVYTGEQWPVIMNTNKSIAYSGKQINDRNFEGNNGDYVGTSFLYNHELSMEQRSLMWLQRMNATVRATDYKILSAEFEPTKYLGYTFAAKTTGISNLKYKFSSPHYDVKHRSYPSLSEGEDQYYGTYSLTRKIEMRSIFENSTYEEDWIPCPVCGWNDMNPADRLGFGEGAQDIFDYTHT